jgi:hypothetical protein
MTARGGPVADTDQHLIVSVHRLVDLGALENIN